MNDCARGNERGRLDTEAIDAPREAPEPGAEILAVRDVANRRCIRISAGKAVVNVCLCVQSEANDSRRFTVSRSEESDY